MKFCSIIFLLATNICIGQEWQAEIMAGISGYNGDLTQHRISLKQMRPAFNLNIKYHSGDVLDMRVGLGYGKVVADDKNNTWGNKKEKVLSSAELDKYTGVYASSQIPIKLNFTREGNNLVCEPTGQEKLVFTNTGKGTFSAEAAGVVVVFDTAKNEMTLTQGVSKFIFKKEK